MVGLGVAEGVVGLLTRRRHSIVMPTSSTRSPVVRSTVNTLPTCLDTRRELTAGVGSAQYGETAAAGLIAAGVVRSGAC
jgi:hypothetical protein